MDVFGKALSGIQSANVRLATSAHNIANLRTEGFKPQRAEQRAQNGGGSVVTVSQSKTPSPVQLEREVIDQIQARVQYTASARVFSVASETTGSLFDLFA